MASLLFPKRPLAWQAVTTPPPLRVKQLRAPPLTAFPPSPHRSPSACPLHRDSNRALIGGFLKPLPRVRSHLSFPSHISAIATRTRRTWTSLWHSLVQDEVQIKGSSAGGLLLGSQQPPRTTERQQPQPGDQPPPRTASQGQPRHHPAARGLRLRRARSRLGWTRRGCHGGRSYQGPWAAGQSARAPAPGVAESTN